MYTVLLVDDEVSVTDTLKTSIPWASLGIEDVYTASDGLQALEFIQNQLIDLLITDIRMPNLDGLALLEMVRKQSPETHCILLTAYGEFEYARQAFRLGVENYLLKPLNMKEILDTIEHAIDNMYASRKNQEILFRENILLRWLNGGISGNELGERASILDINIYHSAFCAVCMRKTSNAVSLSAYGLQCIHSLSSDLDCSPVWDNQGQYLIIIGGREISLKVLVGKFLETAQSLGISDKINVSIGNLVSSCEELHISYQSACKLLNQIEEFHLSPVRASFHDTLVSKNVLPEINYKSLSPIIQKALDYIHESYADNNTSIKDFCTRYTITNAYVGHMFKKETNIFFNNYLNSYRLEKAIELLLADSYKVNEIAVKTGFNTTSYFISSFKRYTGVSPQKYREQISQL